MENLEKSLWNHQKISKSEKEQLKLHEMSSFEREAREMGFANIAGIDEVGRGPLAGPVVTACVILPEDINILGIDDSKKLSAKKRERLFDEIQESAISIAIGIIDEKVIDEINILNATKTAMKSAVAKMSKTPDILLIDAVKLEDLEIKQISIEKGDTLSVSIAAASIIAKVTRDRMMDEMDSIYPEYGFIRNKGYGTKEHIEAIKMYGLCPIHRISFTRNFV
ncbi:MAG: ribonuclease HII [Clostridia bacterium]